MEEGVFNESLYTASIGLRTLKYSLNHTNIMLKTCDNYTFFQCILLSYQFYKFFSLKR